jgi:multidrug resistance efflux pump
MKYPKGFNKWSLDQQEDWLNAQRFKVLKELEKIERQLAAVRGGKKVEIRVDDRPDLVYEKT